MKKFRKFMKAHGVWDQFKANLQANSWRRSLKELSQHTVSDWVDIAFNWANTPEKYKFWQKIDRAWKATRIARFKHWLIKNYSIAVFERYTRNCAKCDMSTLSETLYIEGTFNWKSSTEGINFWKKINIAWRKEI